MLYGAASSGFFHLFGLYFDGIPKMVVLHQYLTRWFAMICHGMVPVDSPTAM
jgi:hypothetical protein